MNWLGRLFRRCKLEAQLDAELRFHIEQRTGDLVASGVEPAEARRRAMIEFGGVERAKEECREARGTYFLETLLLDFRFALRTLRKSPGFTVVAVLTLALGIGASTIIFSAFYGVVLNTFPYKDAARITSFGIVNLEHPSGRGRQDLSLPEFLYFRKHNDVFEGISAENGGFGSTPVRYTTGHSAYQLQADYISVNSFRFFGVKPLLGRLPTAVDLKPGATPVFVIGYRLWRRQFDGDPEVIGKSFTLNGVPRVLVGIMPPRFRWAWVSLWIPFPVNAAEALTNPSLRNQFFYTVGRLKPGVSLEAAAANLDVVAHQYAEIDPGLYPKRFTVVTHSLAHQVTGGFRKLIYPLFAASLLLLLIACTNVANLLLARATTRDKEVAIRASLGAAPGRLIRQFLVESFVLATAGGLGGCLLAWIGIRDLVPLVPYNTFPQEAVITLNLPVLAFALGVSLFVTLALGLVPALRSIRGNFQSRLTAIGRGRDAGFRHGRLRGLLVVTEVAVSIVLLIGAGLLMRTVFHVENVELGFNPHNLLSMQVTFRRGLHQTIRRERLPMRRVLRRIEALPGVASATLALSSPPFGGQRSEIDVPGITHASRWFSMIDLCSRGYFATLQMHLLRGRLLSADDIDSARRVVVVNASFVRRYFSDRSSLGKQVEFHVLDRLPGLRHAAFQIVGVVSDVKNRGPMSPSAPEAYLPYTIFPSGSNTILVRAAVIPNSLIPTIRRQVWSVDSNLAVIQAATVESALRKHTFASPRFEFLIAAVFAAIGLALVMTGIFGVMAYSVSLRIHEIGIRMALGAGRGDIFALVIAKGLGLIGAGIGAGVLVSYGLTRYLANLHLGVRPTDPSTFGAVVILAIVTGLLACIVPARHAMRAHPTAALRQE
jgi:putative ABC transport system permease protein